MWNIFHQVLRAARGWDTQEWLLAFAAVIVIGVFALRGFGSRTTY